MLRLLHVLVVAGRTSPCVGTQHLCAVHGQCMHGDSAGMHTAERVFQSWPSGTGSAMKKVMKVFAEELSL